MHGGDDGTNTVIYTPSITHPEIDRPYPLLYASVSGVGAGDPLALLFIS
jgi:hypothetical protein